MGIEPIDYGLNLLIRFYVKYLAFSQGRILECFSIVFNLKFSRINNTAVDCLK